MFQINLNVDEARVLHDALQCYLTDLRSEVIHTENWEYRQELKRNEACLRQVMLSLELTGTPVTG